MSMVEEKSRPASESSAGIASVSTCAVVPPRSSWLLNGVVLLAFARHFKVLSVGMGVCLFESVLVC